MPCDTPLCPAGHLPHKVGDRYAARASPNIGIGARSSVAPVITLPTDQGQSVPTELSNLPISPLVGEMPGRAEGGITRQTLLC
ncbi:hypothetical protein ELI03_05220, partial [Rhizobium leguminosarum]